MVGQYGIRYSPWTDGDQPAQSPITYRGIEYDVNNPAQMGAYLEVMRANTRGQLSDIRGGQRADEIVETISSDPALTPESKPFTPQYQALYDYGNANTQTIQDYYKGKGRDDLATWAEANPALGAKQFLKESGADLAQNFLDRKIMEQTEGNFSVASQAQVPDFAPDKANLNFESDEYEMMGRMQPEMIDFQRNNTSPGEVVPFSEQFEY